MKPQSSPFLYLLRYLIDNFHKTLLRHFGAKIKMQVSRQICHQKKDDCLAVLDKLEYSRRQLFSGTLICCVWRRSWAELMQEQFE